jgi:hypothetical protein
LMSWMNPSPSGLSAAPVFDGPACGKPRLIFGGGQRPLHL